MASDRLSTHPRTNDIPMGLTSNDLSLVADIGGTHARFALADSQANLYAHSVFKTNDFATVLLAIEHYMALHNMKGIKRVGLAVATPIVGDRVKMTNHPWQFSITELQTQLALEQLVVKNDFAALANAVPLLADDDVVQLGGTTPMAHHPVAVVGPGTGLGVAGLMFDEQQWQVVEGEGGHVAYSPMTAIESQVLSHYWAKGLPHVSAEHLISGPGLQGVYEALCQIEGVQVVSHTAAGISQNAMAAEANPTKASKDELLCLQSVDVFCASLGTVAANLALTLGARGGVYIGGGIVPKLGDLLHRSECRQRFELHTRMAAYLKPIPLYVIHAQHTALVGMHRYLADPI